MGDELSRESVCIGPSLPSTECSPFLPTTKAASGSLFFSKAAFAAPELKCQISVHWYMWAHTVFEQHPQQMQKIIDSVTPIKLCLFKTDMDPVHFVN